METRVILNSEKTLYCSYCGEKIISGEDFILIQKDYNNVEIKHVECENC